ncbi:MAG: hypothetical protein A2Y12_15555 [Planctomycetes bacterium GWF2_42_9]|nr:MAG: hypothetical protein A2Y12_15555 [Planctomycetes bacterium GWF2_42_9]
MQIVCRNAEDVETLKLRASKEINAKQRDRYRAVKLALDGHSTQEIMRMLGICTVEDYVQLVIRGCGMLKV